MSDTGFWIPVDGGKDIYTQENWLPNNQIRGFIKKMKARHIALVSDSCFSGGILNPSRGMISEIKDDYFKKAYTRVSRQVLTSRASETVPDVSLFAQQLKLALEGNSRPYLDPLMLYNEIRLGVPGTTPSVEEEPSKPELLDKIPHATIKIDGKFEDWSDIPPMFIDEVGDKVGSENGMDIEKVYLARDSKYIYVKFDIADGSFNSQWETRYNVVIHITQGVYISLTTRYNKYRHKWTAIISKYEDATKEYDVISTGWHRRKGSSFEARFLLSSIGEYVQMGDSYYINAEIGYQDEKNRFIGPDPTQGRTIQF